MRPWILLNVIWALERKEINEWKLEEQYREGDDLEPEDLPEHERPKKPIDFENVCHVSYAKLGITFVGSSKSRIKHIKIFLLRFRTGPVSSVKEI